jgi:CHAT domain-containing protein
MRLAILAWLALVAGFLAPAGASLPASPKEMAADAPLSQVQAAIPEGSALVELATTGSRVMASVLHRSGAVAQVNLGAVDRIDRAVDRLRVALSDPTLDPKPAARALDALVMQPIRSLLGDSTSVLLSADGALDRVPMSALYDEDGHYLLERISFTYLTNRGDLLRMAAPSPAREGALVFANPAFDLDASPASIIPPSIDLGKARFPALPATLEEGQAVGRALGAAKVLTGPDATEGAVKALHGPRVLHIATHGFSLKGRAGLAFAGANLRRSGAEDGILTALEAASLDLRGTKLVVLSGCETSHGLRNALSLAGAETQVTSLWKVDDEATAELMVAYYRTLGGGAGRSLAMRTAQLAVRANEETAHPYYWAGFIVSGNPAPLSGVSPSRTAD